MVKVQKPTPKTLSKAGNLETVLKKKKSEKLQKQNVAPVPVTIKKKKLIEKSVKAEVAAAPILPKPLKKQKQVEKKNQTQNENNVEKPITTKKNKQQKQTAKAAEVKRPLVLAPPKSPKPQQPKKAQQTNNKKQKQQKEPKKSADLPITATTTNSKKQKQKNKAKAKKAGEQSKNNAGKDNNAQQPKPVFTKMQQKKSAKRAFTKQLIKKRKSGKIQNKAPQPKIFEPISYDEDKFNAIVNVANIKKIAKALKRQVEEEVNAKKTSIFSDYRYFLNVCSFKIPSCPKRMVKLNLKHSLVDREEDDVVIIVTDLQRGAKADYEPTVQHYEDLFREAGVEGLKIMPFNQLRNECGTFETVRKLGNTYDYFLCDGRIVARVAGFCGKIFQKPRTTFHAVRMENTKNLKNEIEKSLRRTAYKQLHKGDLISIPIGNHKFTALQLAENVEYVVSQLKSIYPGGLGNVRSMNLKIDIVGTSSLPIYISMAQPPVDTPFVVGPREQRLLKLKKEANDVLSKFHMTKDADIVKLTETAVKRKRELKEARTVLLEESKAKKKAGPGAAKDDDGDEGGNAVPRKKPRKDTEPEQDNKNKKSNQKSEEEEEAEGEDSSDDADDTDSDDDDEAESGDDDEDEDDDGDEDGDDDDDDDGDDDDDEEGNDDDDAEGNEADAAEDSD